MANLALKISQANFDYYVADKSTMTDAEYDGLVKQLRRLEAENPGLKSPLTPTETVGVKAATSSFEKVKHKAPMLSLDNTFSAKEIVEFFHRKLGEEHLSRPDDQVECLVEPKIDGLSLSLHYNQFGLLERAVTRGDGSTGDDVTQNARGIKSIPKLIDPKVCPIEIRGEVYFELAQFTKINQQLEAAGEDIFANPRNAASGTMKRKDSETVAARGLSFIAYQVVNERVHRDLENQLMLLDFLVRLGFYTPLDVTTDDGSFFWSVSDLTEESFNSVIEQATAIRPGLPFEVDGLVIKLQSLGLQSLLGLNNRSPNWATSYKFPPEQKATRLESITVQVGRLGTLTPVAELAPVSLGGTTIRRATLHNCEEIARLGINVGDMVIVQKAAEVIPAVSSYPEGRVYTCPECGFVGTLAEQKRQHEVPQQNGPDQT